MSHGGGGARHVLRNPYKEDTMSRRTNPYTAATAPLMQQWITAATELTKEGLEYSLKELVKIRASQMNGCVVCLDMHIREALQAGESQARIDMLNAWEESDLYTPREKAALAWTESLTRLHETRAPDAVYEMMAEHFTEEEQVRLTMSIAVINAFNKFGVGFRVPPMKPVRQAA
jgi:AhpD family alkylhydroperoxidase